MSKNNGLAHNTDRGFGIKSHLATQHDFHGSAIRSLVGDRASWFVAADGCSALHIGNPSAAVGRLDEDEKGITTVDTLGGPQEVVVVSESGLYALTLRSRKPQARAFRRWVTGEVIPSIRRTGAYSGGERFTLGLHPDFSEPGRYVTMVVPGLATHTQHYRLEALLDDVAENEAVLMALTMKMVEAWWRKAEHLAAIGLETRGSFAAAGLERAIREGATLADRLLALHHRGAQADQDQRGIARLKP